MMGPDYTHWHGTYEVAKHFYSEDGAGARALDQQGQGIGRRQEGRCRRQALGKKLDEVLNSANHRWYLDKMDPEEREERRLRQEEFQKRYSK